MHDTDNPCHIISLYSAVIIAIAIITGEMKIVWHKHPTLLILSYFENATTCSNCLYSCGYLNQPELLSLVGVGLQHNIKFTQIVSTVPTMGLALCLFTRFTSDFAHSTHRVDFQFIKAVFVTCMGTKVMPEWCGSSNCGKDCAILQFN